SLIIRSMLSRMPAIIVFLFMTYWDHQLMGPRFLVLLAMAWVCLLLSAQNSTTRTKLDNFKNKWYFTHRDGKIVYYCGSCGREVSEEEDTQTIVTTRVSASTITI